MDDLKLMTVRALRELAKERLGAGHSKLKTKADADAFIRDNFATVCSAAVAGRLAHWEVHPKSFVALVVALDQFPRWYVPE